MDNFNVKKTILLVNGKEEVESYRNNIEDIDERIEHYLEYDTSNKFLDDAVKVTFSLYEENDYYESHDHPHTVVFSKFKEKWYGSDYRFSFKGYYKGDLLISVDGNEIDVANYLYQNIEEIKNEFNLKLDVDEFRLKIKPDDYLIEDLVIEMGTPEANFEFENA